MLVIRLKRVGKKKQAFFRLALQEKEWAPKGKAIELLGFYDPHNAEKTTLNTERIEHWISKGAQPSPTVHNLLVDAAIIQGEKVQAWKPKKRDTEEATSDEEKPTQPNNEEEAPDQPEAGKTESGEPQEEQDADEPEETGAPDQEAADDDTQPEADDSQPEAGDTEEEEKDN